MNAEQLQQLDNLIRAVEPKDFFAGIESSLRRTAQSIYTAPGVGVLETRKAVLLELNADVLRSMIDSPPTGLIL